MCVPCELRLGQALLGCSVSVQTIDGMAELQVPAGTMHGERLRMRGKGIFNPRRGIKVRGQRAGAAR